MSPIVLGVLVGAYIVIGTQFANGARYEIGPPLVSFWLRVATAAIWPLLVLATIGFILGRWFVRSLPEDPPHRG